jgi:hypothetical protein
VGGGVHDAIPQYAAVTVIRLIKPPYLNRSSDGLSWHAMIRSEKIWDMILVAIIQQSAGADVRPIVVEQNSANGVLFEIAIASCILFAS